MSATASAAALRRSACGPIPCSCWRCMALWIALALVFNGEPEIDQAVSSMFFAAQPCAQGSQASVCGGFPAAANVLLASAPQLLPLSAGRRRHRRRGDPGARSRRRPRVSPMGASASPLTALAALLIGPGLIVNVFLKDYWGRPRPASTDLFGGTLPFVPAGQWSNACPDNCSFVSGEASSIFWLVCLIPLWPRQLARQGGAGHLRDRVFTAGLRVAFGGHYLSDVVLGGLSTLIVFATLAVLVERVYDASRQG